MAWMIPDKGEGVNDIRVVFIYALLDPGTRAVRYVGKTGDPKRRLRMHMAERNSARRSHRTNWLRSLRERPLLEILEHDVPEQSASERECWWIAEMRRRGCRLTNATDGGEGQTGLRHTAEAKARISAASKGHVVTAATREKIRAAQLGKRRALGCKHSSEARERHRQAALGKGPFRGRVHSPETLAKMRAAQAGHTVSAETRAKISAARSSASPSTRALALRRWRAKRRATPPVEL